MALQCRCCACVSADDTISPTQCTSWQFNSCLYVGANHIIYWLVPHYSVAILETNVEAV